MKKTTKKPKEKSQSVVQKEAFTYPAISVNQTEKPQNETVTAPTTQTGPVVTPTGTQTITNPYTVTSSATGAHTDQTPPNPVSPSQPAQNISVPVSPSETTVDTENASEFFDEEPSNGSGKKILLVFLIALVIGALIVGGYFFLQSKSKSKPKEEPTPSVNPTSTVTEASPTAVLTTTQESTSSADFESYSVQVLNGSGIAGQAGVVEEQLKKLGFTDITTGNADSFDYKDTEVKVKKDVPNSVFESIQKQLVDYTVVEGTVLDASSKYDVIVIVGAKKE